MRRTALVLWMLTAAVLGPSSAGCSLTRTFGEPDAFRAERENAVNSEYSYSGGRGVQDFAAASSAVKVAVFEALGDLQMRAIRGGRDAGTAQIDATTADGRSATVTVRPQQGLTRVSCRIGWFGDGPMSRALLQRVGVRLGTLPPAAVPEEIPSKPTPNPLFSRDAVPDSLMMRDFADAPYRDRPDF